VKLPHKLAGSAFALFVLAAILALRPTWQAQAASIFVSGGQGSITVTLSNVAVGESITVCGTGGPTVCLGGPTPAGGGTGTFNSVSPSSCGLTLTGGGQQNFVSFTSTCSGTITLTWQCLSSGPITFFLTSSIPGQQSQSCSLGTSGGNSAAPATGSGSICVSGNCVALTANPNVVSCKGGSTTVTAFAHYQLPQIGPATPITTAPNGLPMAQQPYFFFTVTEGIALIQQTTNNTAVVTLLEGMPEARVTATTGGVTNTIRIIPYCRPGTTGTSATVAGTPGAAPVAVSTPAATPAPIGSLTITASPGSLQTCDGSVFLSATVKDANGKLVPDGTNVLFIATRGILDPASANTILGTANIVYTADLKTSGTVKLSAQAGSAFASVDVPVTCGGSASGSTTSGGTGATSPGSPGFQPPNTGQAGETPFRITPPRTGDAGLKVINEDDSLSFVPGDACSDLLVGEVKS
jgi:hypothetical protein